MGLCEASRLQEDHQPSIEMEDWASFVNSRVAEVHTYPGLRPVAELIPEAKTFPVNMMWKYPMIVKCVLQWV